MNSAVKLIIGIVVFLAGVYWYVPGNAVAPALGLASTVKAFITVFGGLFGLVLIFLGLIVAWIEYEDLRWEAQEKKGKKK